MSVIVAKIKAASLRRCPEQLLPDSALWNQVRFEHHQIIHNKLTFVCFSVQLMNSALIKHCNNLTRFSEVYVA